MSASRYDPIQKALELVEVSLSKPLAVKQIAADVGVSSFHFQRLFVRDMGETVSNYARSRRLERAATILIEQPTINLLDLALECGFQTHSAFTRAFRRQFGMTPTEFVDGGGHALLQASSDARPFLTPARANELDHDVTMRDLPDMWLMARGHTGVSGGTYFVEENEIAEGFQELVAEMPSSLSSLCGAFKVGPKGLSDPDAIGQYGGIFDEKPGSEWGEIVEPVPAGEWAVFPHHGSLNRLHMTWNKAVRSWLPQADFDLRPEWMFEFYYAGPDVVDPKQLTAEIFLPVEKSTNGTI